MKIVSSPKEMSGISSRLKQKGKTIGFVPTMGYLHDGHISLIKEARRDNDIVVVSIFVNPTQFGPKEDYKKYPRDFKRDAVLAKQAGCGIIFHPSASGMYPAGHLTYVFVRDLSRVMCGASRPTHFEGVTTVCAKLFNIIKPDVAYFGKKDYQQALIVKRMVEDLNMGFKVKVMPIVREKSGLAMSSRNKYLTAGQREDAAVLYSSLKEAKRLIKAGEKNSSTIKEVMRRKISAKDGRKIDYITIADPSTLKEKARIDSAVLIALAAWVGKTRLIDNILV